MQPPDSPGSATDQTDKERQPILSALRRLGLWPNGHGAPLSRARGEADGDRHQLRFIERYLRNGDAVLDVGAGAGTLAIAAGRIVGPAGRVDAIEPSPTMRRQLTDAIAAANLKSVVVVHALMAGASAGLGRFADGSTRTGKRRQPLPGELATHVVGIEQVRLDRFIGRRRYAMLCLNVAGNELGALRGAEQALRQGNPPALLVSVDAALADYGVTPAGLAEWLDDHGYESIHYDSDRNMIEYPIMPWRQRRRLLAMARGSRNFVLHRLADTVRS